METGSDGAVMTPPIAGLPRTLILSATEISASTATGSLLRELFADFPQEKIAQIVSYLSPDEVSARYIHKKTLNYAPRGLFPVRRINQLMGLSFESNPKFAHIFPLIQSFKPEVVYLRVTDDLFPFLDLAISVSRNFKAPIVSHSMDDYESAMKLDCRWWNRVVRWRMFESDLKTLFRFAVLNFSISGKMSTNFSQRYGVEFKALHNGVDPDVWGATNAHAGSNLRVGNLPQFTILMAGSLDAKKEYSIIDRVARIVNALNEESTLSCRLILNVPDYCLATAEQMANRYTGVSAQRYVPLQAYRELLRSVNCLLLARNSDDVTRAYTGLSFHNKLPEYMMSGTPILYIGPTWDTSAELCTKLGTATVIVSDSDQEIRDTILEMARSPERFQLLAERARGVANEKFNLKEIRREFERDLRDTSTAWKLKPN